MSVHESFEAVRDASSPNGATNFSRWPGLLTLTLGWVAGPVVALANQELMYSVNMWACGRGIPGVIHIVPAVCIVVAIGAGLLAYRDWRAVGKGVEDEDVTVHARTRFIALGGMAISVFSSLVILAMWSAAFTFDPCMRA